LAATVAAAVAARGLRSERPVSADPHDGGEANEEAPTVTAPEPFATGGENDAPAGYHLYRPGKRSKAEDYPDNP
ncbi:MAG TPA: hypothetical protein VGF17_13815, partial [Phytomonospora sp.]